jgi:hypothetical protein
LKGAAAGESKGGFVTRAHDKAVKAEPAAKATQLTEENKKQVRAKAKEDVKKEVKQKDTEKKGVLEKDKNDAAAALNKAKTDAAASKEAADMVRAEAQKEEPKLKQEAETKVIQNTIEREPEMKQAKEEVRVVEKEKADMVTTHNDDIQKMAVAAEKMSGDVREKQMRDIEQKKAEHTQAIKAIDARITTAKDKVNTIDTEIKAPLAQFEERKKKAAETLAERVKEHQEKQKLVDTLDREFKQKDAAFRNFKETSETEIDKLAKKRGEEMINKLNAEGIEHVAKETATTKGLVEERNYTDHDVQHIVEHHLKDRFKTKGRDERLLSAIQDITKEQKDGGGAAH